MYKIIGKEVKDYVEDYIIRMKKVCKEVNKNHIYNYNSKTLLKGLNEIIDECERRSDYNKFIAYFMKVVYLAYLDKDSVSRAGIEDIFLENFYKDLKKGMIKELSSLEEEEVERYIEKLIDDYIGSIKLGINSLRFNGMENIGAEMYSLKEDGECRYFTYDLINNFYDIFIQESKDYLAVCIKVTLKESLKIYENKEQIYNYYTNGRGKEMIVRSVLYGMENPFARYKEIFEKLENNDFSEFREKEVKIKAENNRECER